MTAGSCPRCGLRHQCFCPWLPKLHSRQRLLRLIHPNELQRDTNTGKLLALCQLNVESVVWDRKNPPASLLALLEDSALFPVLLFPGEHSLTLDQLSSQSHQQHKQPLFIILDATWQEARKMVNKSRWLSSVPLMALTSAAPSQYQLRRNQQTGNLCTFEVAAHLLGQLDEKSNQQYMLEFLDDYSAAFKADKSGHALKQ
ncbi:DTW domain-containing protein [Vibrio sp. CAU 1672]|uniref:tRNA-uridine aminocarboxypropyltransferase n=1 Tax=Vibrio sp. CAU 1672 TaxID=3032594 RepID=UPI0023DAD8BF|nr:DTW domain-containing protein [Vibrio sp. CAU 1672]MDF2155906.1 DTW domain-containing protein [Vibrio sp. CAU 1672]